MQQKEWDYQLQLHSKSNLKKINRAKIKERNLSEKLKAHTETAESEKLSHKIGQNYLSAHSKEPI